MRIENKLNPNTNVNQNIVMERYLDKYSELLMKRLENKLK
jgi:hypothetical protein